MSEQHELFKAVDDYVVERIVGMDDALASALTASSEAGLPAISVAPNQGKLLQILARGIRARRVLEIGTLGGFSTIWLARALPENGRLITLEVSAAHAEVAERNLERAGVAHFVDIRVGPALETLPQLADSDDPFDLVFIDADKVNIPAYVDWAVRLTRPGGLIFVDNVIRKGQVGDAANSDPDVAGTRQMYDDLASDDRVTATAVQTVGSKGHDGFLLAVVNG